MVSNLQVVEPDIDLELNTTGKLVFTLPADHPHKAHINPLVSEFTAYDGTTEIFCGRMINKTEDFYNTGHVVCEGELAYLLDSTMRPYEYTGTITDFVDMVLNNHNSQVESRKQIQRGTITVTDSNNNIAREDSGFSNSLAVLQEKLVKTHGGYLRIRKVNGVKHLDYIYDFGGTNSQAVRFGENLLDIERFIDASGIITALIPTGATIDNEDGTSSTVDIKSVNNNIDYIVNQSGVNTYGYIWGHKEWENVTLPENLLAKATAYLEEQIALPNTINLTAADLHLIDSGIAAYKFGYWTKVESVPHGINQLFMTSKIHISMQHPNENTLSLGKVVTTFTGNAVKNMGEISAKVNQTAKHLSSEINEKVHNATQLITGGLGGYIVIKQSENDGHPEEILIMNAPSTEDATHVIRFNQNGIGFSTTGIGGPYANAWTIDGNLVADFITAGKLTGIIIEGNTIVGNTINGGTINGTIINGGSVNGGTFTYTGPGGTFTVDGTGVRYNDNGSGNQYVGLIHSNSNELHLGGERCASYFDNMGSYLQCASENIIRAANNASDFRLKKGMIRIDRKFSKAMIQAVKTYQFEYKNFARNELNYGIIAQELIRLLNELGIDAEHVRMVDKNIDGYYKIQYEQFIPHLINVIQDQQKDIDTMKEQLGIKEDK